MDFFVTYNNISSFQLILYNVLMIAVFLYLFWKYRNASLAQCIVLIFMSGVFSDLGQIFSLGNSMSHIYKVCVIVWAFFLFRRYGYNKKNNAILLCFVIYILYFFFISVFLHDDNLGLVVSQVLSYTIPVAMFLVVDAFLIRYRLRGMVLLNMVLRDLIIAQIVFCGIKLLILQATQEGWVGSLTGIRGGGAGTSFPLLCLLWLAVNTRMKFTWKNLLLMIGFLFIGFMTGKRAVWLLFPLLYAILMAYYKIHTVPQFLKISVPLLLFALLFFYFGVRLSPTLNPEHKVWGSFDPVYAYNYALNYSGGTRTNAGEIEVKEGEGRLGAVVFFWNDLIHVFDYDRQKLFGVGNEYIKYADRADYFNSDYYFGISYRGGVTGIVMMYFISGLFGLFLFLLYYMQIMFRIPQKGFRWILIGTVLFDFVFYNGQIMGNIAMQVMLMIVIFISRKYDKVYLPCA